MKERVPLAYLHGHLKRRYLATWPIFLDLLSRPEVDERIRDGLRG